MTIPKFLVWVEAKTRTGGGPKTCTATVDGERFVTAEPFIEGLISCQKNYPS